MKPRRPYRRLRTATEVDWFAHSEPGPEDWGNDDFVMGDAKQGIFVVSDGLSGGPEGRLASETGARAFVTTLRKVEPEKRVGRDMLQRALKAANNRVWNMASSDVSLKGMGSTLSGVVCFDGRCGIVHVGDSRVYRFRQGMLTQLTHDHTLPAELVRSGLITKKAAGQHALRHLLTHCLGTSRVIDGEVVESAFQKQDWFVLVTDGVTDVLTDAELQDILSHGKDGNAERVCLEIVRQTRERKALDDASVLVVRRAQEMDSGRTGRP